MDDDENLSMLLSMGFPDIGEIKRALRLAKNDINEAVAILTMEQPLSSYGTVDDLRDVNADIDMRDVNASGSTFIGPMNATAAQQRPGSSTTDEGDKGGDGNSLEFPATNLYELEQRVFQVSRNRTAITIHNYIDIC
jgi:ubiquitin carboxyl-terminal hydrolase 9/24